MPITSKLLVPSTTSIDSNGVLSQPSPVTTNDIATEAMSFFVGKDVAIEFKPTSGGVNNYVLYVKTTKNENFILRIYNNGNDSSRVAFEHKILKQLKNKKMSFSIPTTIPSFDGRSHVLLSNGAEASLFKLIPGSLPKLSLTTEIGEAAGELLTAMEEVKIDVKSPNPRYCDLFKAHHFVTRELFFAETDSSAFDSCRDAINYLNQEIRDIELKIKEFKTLNLPEQWVLLNFLFVLSIVLSHRSYRSCRFMLTSITIMYLH